MSENEYVNKSLTFDAETLRRLQAMANETDRSISAMARVAINNEYERLQQAKQIPPFPTSETE